MIRSAYFFAGLIFLALVGAKFDRATGFTSLVRFGETWSNQRYSTLSSLPIATVTNSNGYDGQFYAQIALDPLLRSPELTNVIDAPAYRAHRILTPSLAALLGVGNPWWTLQAYALLNVAAWLALAWVMKASIAGNDWRAVARWVGCMFSLGVLESVRQSLVDLPALLLLALAADSQAQRRAGKSTFWLALGNLAKETTALATLALHTTGLFDKAQRPAAATSILLAMVPLGLWWWYVSQRFSAQPNAESMGNFAWPFVGLFTQAKLNLHEISRGNFDGRYTFGVIAMIGIAIQAVTLSRAPDLKSPWWRIGVAYALLLPFLSIWVWSGYWAACRAALPLTIAFNLILPSNRAFWPLWIAGNLTLLHGLWRFL